MPIKVNGRPPKSLYSTTIDGIPAAPSLRVWTFCQDSAQDCNSKVIALRNYVLMRIDVAEPFELFGPGRIDFANHNDIGPFLPQQSEHLGITLVLPQHIVRNQFPRLAGNRRLLCRPVDRHDEGEID